MSLPIETNEKNQAYQIDAFTNADQLSQTGHQNGLGLYSDINQGATGRVPQANVRSFFVVLSPLSTAKYTHNILNIQHDCTLLPFKIPCENDFIF